MNTPYEALLRELHRARRFLVWRSIERAGVFATLGFVVLAGLGLCLALLLPLHRAEYVTLRTVLLVAALCAFGFALARVMRSTSYAGSRRRLSANVLTAGSYSGSATALGRAISFIRLLPGWEMRARAG